MPKARNAADEIRQIYFAATKATIAADLERAIALLISLDSDEARERVAVYMDGLSQMRSEWSGAARTKMAVAPAKAEKPRSAAASRTAKARGR